MNQKFGGGTGTPSLAWYCVVVIASLLTGASVVHNFFKPNLTLPPIENGADEAIQRKAQEKQ
ncbi:OLC1v1027641C1 [Oldenlandia corymbosa var. corymbosa]|uniref:OLC1v1027641C1 n=1 Tax=Oldenlandia corymbosa var. corymbosa TaxID=529605 RepID=A0AAV1CC69_OLDCO|nr:OLC1v1027641C1 [Oldenlandia corymbosa var. corymbosa]